MYAIYLEFSTTDPKGEIYLGLFIPSGFISASRTAPLYASKRLTPQRPRRVWEVHHDLMWRPQGEPVDLQSKVESGTSQINTLSNYLRVPVGDPKWVAVGSFPVEVTLADLLLLKDTPARIPAEINARIKEQRSERNFPALFGDDND